MNNLIVQILFISIFSFPTLNALNILIVLPCYGGHFGAMVTILQQLSRDNDVTVISTSPVCDKKLEPIRKRASFELIREDIILGELDLTGRVIGFVYLQL